MLTPGEGDLLEIERRQPSAGLGNCCRLEVACGAWASGAVHAQQSRPEKSVCRAIQIRSDQTPPGHRIFTNLGNIAYTSAHTPAQKSKKPPRRVA